MAKLKYNLNDDERIVYKVSCVRHGFWGAYTNSLVVTNQAVILEKYGLLDNFKGIVRYDYKDIKQVIEGEASNGEEQLEIYINNSVEDFALQSGDKKELKMLIKAINDQMSQEDDKHDYNYYQDLLTEEKDTARLIELRKMVDKDNESSSSGFGIVGSAAKNILKSGDLSFKGVAKGISKAAKKQKRKQMLNGIMDELNEDGEIDDIKDEFTEIKNEFREEFGLKPIMTNANKKELMELEAKFEKKKIEKEKEKTNKKSLNDINEQLDALKKAKELYDAGVLTKEEFEKKKKELLD